MASQLGGSQQLAVMAAALCLLVCAGNALDTKIVQIKNYTKVSQSGVSTLYQVETGSDSGYEHPPLLVHLVGSRHGEC